MEESDKPVAVLTAFRGEFDLQTNRARNEQLKKDLRAAGLSYYPVTGSGQEVDDRGLVNPTKEESFVVQPEGEMDEDTFKALITKVMNDHNQDFVAMKFPGQDSILLGKDGSTDPLGRSAHPRRANDPFFSELLKGARTPPSQQSGWEREGETDSLKRFANWMRGRKELNEPVPEDEKGGRRFVVGDPPRRPQGEP